MGEGHDAEAEGVQVPRLQHHLGLHQDERHHLGQGVEQEEHLQGELHAEELQGEVQGEVAQGEPRLVGQGEDQERAVPAGGEWADSPGKIKDNMAKEEML